MKKIFWFNEKNKKWKETQYDVIRFLDNQTAVLFDMLEDRGYLFLNEAYEAFGFDATKDGKEYGWMFYDKPRLVRFNFDHLFEGKKKVKITFDRARPIYEIVYGCQ